MHRELFNSRSYLSTACIATLTIPFPQLQVGTHHQVHSKYLLLLECDFSSAAIFSLMDSLAWWQGHFQIRKGNVFYQIASRTTQDIRLLGLV